MTPAPAPVPLVAVCQGHRCRALLAGQQTGGMDVLRNAARSSASGVLVSTECAGPCSHGPVAALGTGVHQGSELRLVTRMLLGPLDAAHVRALANYLQADALLATPPVLDEVVLVPSRASTTRR